MQEQELLEEIERTLGEISCRHEQQEETTPLPECETQSPPASSERGPQEQMGTPIIHIYVVDAPPPLLEEDERTIESTLEAAEEADVTNNDESEPPLPVTHAALFRSRRISVPLLLLVLFLLLAVLVSASYLVPLLTASATVTIIPKSVEISGSTTLTLVSAPPHPGSAQVAGRLLSTLTLSQAQEVPTTGTTHQPAQAAHGTITFYNALPQAQTIPAGTLLIGADGVQVVTDEDALLPAAQMPTEGQVSVSAHALVVGSAGNIRANDLYGACCRADVFAQNSMAFHGGQHARDFPVVRAQDIAGAVTTLKTSLQASVQAAMLTQVQPGETLLTPVPCTPQVATDHAVGEEARQVRVRLDETCRGETYDTQAVQILVLEAVTQEALMELGAGYSLTGAVQVTGVTMNPSPVKDQQHESLVLHVRGMGTWAYQFSDTQLHEMAQLIAGKSREQATNLLLAQPGVSQVAMTVSGVQQTDLPADAGQIHLLVLSRAA
ncbi:MAG TPA: baseplate J/gp47 family protein [Ktedonobacteraceae bacterium]